MDKVICLGLHKTGTSSFKSALEMAGYRVSDWFGLSDPDIQINATEIALGLLQDFDAAQDDPWYLIYEDLDRALPNAKFVLTLRDHEKWFHSCQKHFGSQTNQVREWFYGSGYGAPLDKNRDIWIRRKLEHEQNVREYFKNRSGQFLELDICGGEGWEKLAPFLHLPAPQSAGFPKTNTKHEREHDRLYRQFTQSTGMKKFYYRLRMKVIRSLYF